MTTGLTTLQSTNTAGEAFGQRPVTKWGKRPAALVTVAHVVDAYQHYPGELVTFFTCVKVSEDTMGLTLRIALPEGLVLHDYRPPLQCKDSTPYVEVIPADERRDKGYEVVWLLADKVVAGVYEYQTQVRIDPTPYNIDFTSCATVTRDDEPLSEECVTFTAHSKGHYLRYLPEIYEDDELMGRFLMLFESFWAPIEMQIDNIHGYFNPEMTPPAFLRWLASWFDLALHEHLPEERQRSLVREIVPLYRRRGTRQGLQRYLEIYTGGEVYIIEQRAENFCLGSGARLGPGIALGRNNHPHTFTVMLRLPEEEAGNPAWIADICSLIETEKPAHTAYTLNVEPLA